MPVDALNDCAGRASASLSGIKQIAAVCPQIEQTLESLGLDDILYDGWRQQLNAYALRDLTELVQRYGDPQRQTSPNTASLPEILSTLTRQQTPAVRSWWDSLKSRLREWLTHSDSAVAKWLNQWLEHLEVSGTVLNAAVLSLLALVVIAAVVVIVREIKASGFAGRRGAAKEATPESEAGQAAENPSDRPSAAGIRGLLQSLITLLTQTGRLKAERSLTHRELIMRSALDSEAQRGVLAGVARTAESILYGSQGAAPSSSEQEQVLRQGSALLAQLSAQTRPP